MKYKTIDTLNIKTSILGFGCMRFPLLENGKIDERATEEMLDKAIASGVNYIDTAYPYLNGESEPLVGRILKKYERNSFYLATKMPMWAFETQEEALKIFNKQLKRLQTDYIDFYLLHALDKNRFEKAKNLGIIELCEELQKEGKIKYFGFSFHDSYEVFEEILKYRKWDFCQIQFNYMDTLANPGIEGYNLATEMNVPLIVMEPIKGGSLAKFSNDIEKIFKDYNPGDSIASWALRFVGSFDNVKVMLSGMSNMEQVEDNLNTVKDFKPLNKEEEQVVIKAVDAIRSRVKNGCTGCKYCMPCPQGVNIPKIFYMWNLQSMYDNYNIIRYSYSQTKEEEKPKNCIGCKKCEKVCPQHISISQDLIKANEVLKVLENK